MAFHLRKGKSADIVDLGKQPGYMSETSLTYLSVLQRLMAKIFGKDRGANNKDLILTPPLLQMNGR